MTCIVSSDASAMHPSHSNAFKAVAKRGIDFLDAFSIIKSSNERKQPPSLPRASAGCTAVYFPANSSLVLKHSRNSCGMRYQKMEQARSLCRQLQCSRLTVPQARIYDGYLIEDRVPIEDVDPRYQIGFYLHNCQKFAGAAREFTRFICHSRFTDLIEEGGIYARLSKDKVIRYDNIPLYIDPVTGEGCIALIDLEHFSVLTKPATPPYPQLELVVRLFPQQFEIIIQEIKSLYPGARESDLDSLQKVQKVSNALHGSLYWNHYIKLSEDQSLKVLPKSLNSMSLERKMEIVILVEDAIQQELIQSQQELIQSQQELEDDFIINQNRLNNVRENLEQISQLQENNPIFNHLLTIVDRTVGSLISDLKKIPSLEDLSDAVIMENRIIPTGTTLIANGIRFQLEIDMEDRPLFDEGLSTYGQVIGRYDPLGSIIGKILEQLKKGGEINMKVCSTNTSIVVDRIIFL